MKPLEEMLLVQKALRNPPLKGSVMSQPSSPEPYIGLSSQQEPGLEQVSPEDFIPSPKSLAATTMKVAPMLGAMGAIKNAGAKVIPMPTKGQFGTTPLRSTIEDAMERQTRGIGIKPYKDGGYVVTVDGVPAFREDSLRAAEDAAKNVDADFWRGELGISEGIVK